MEARNDRKTSVSGESGQGVGYSQGQLGQLGTFGRGRPIGGVAGASKEPTVTGEQMEISRLRAESARLLMGLEIAKKAATYFSQDTLRGMPGLSKASLAK